MDFSPGTDALIQATTLENQFYSIAITIQAIERNPTHNPNDDINIVTATYDSDTGIFSGSVDTYVNVTWLADGTHSISYPDPYTSYTSWSEGTSGQGNAQNINHALAQRALWLVAYERSEVYNLGNVDPKFTGVSWTYVDTAQTLPVVHNAKLAIDFSIGTLCGERTKNIAARITKTIRYQLLEFLKGRKDLRLKVLATSNS